MITFGLTLIIVAVIFALLGFASGGSAFFSLFTGESSIPNIGVKGVLAVFAIVFANVAGLIGFVLLLVGALQEFGVF